jgi:cyclohexyl-isocyanide hydratase
MSKLQIGLLVFPRVQQLDLTAPYEVFASMPDTDVHLVWKSGDSITSATGLVLQPSMTFETCPKLDVVCVPGGLGVNDLLEDESVLDFLRRQAEGARFVTSVCTGSLVLGAAGLLHGVRATSHWSAHDLLAAFGAIPTQGRVVQDGRFITGGGVTAGIDFALTVAAVLLGRPAAEAIQLQYEYAPAPPFDAGTPETAPADVLQAVRTRGSANRKAREILVDRIAKRIRAPASRP